MAISGWGGKDEAKWVSGAAPDTHKNEPRTERKELKLYPYIWATRDSSPFLRKDQNDTK